VSPLGTKECPLVGRSIRKQKKFIRGSSQALKAGGNRDLKETQAFSGFTEWNKAVLRKIGQGQQAKLDP
jgi:hypothetical protein